MTITIAPAGRVTAKLAPVVRARPAPGTAETAGFTVPLMEMLVRSWTGVVAPPFVWPDPTRVQRVPAVPGEKPVSEMVAACWLLKSLFAMNTVRLPPVSVDAHERTVVALEEQDTRLRPKIFERNGYTYHVGCGLFSVQLTPP